MILSVDKLWTHYGPVEALRGVTFEIEEGELVAIIGNNGAGKSTLLNTISGLVEPTSGSMTFLGKPLMKMQANDIVRLGIAQVPEGRRIFPSSSVYENLLAGAYIRTDNKSIQEDIMKFFEIFPVLGERKNQKAGYLSGGEQQMLAISRALMSRPKLLLLDEPSLGLAPVVVKDIYEIIRTIHEQGTTILLVEQNANVALQNVDRGYVMENGTLTLSGTAKELMSNEKLQKIYMGM